MDLIHERGDMLASGYVGLASYTFLLYDHLVTFGDEVNYIWKGNKGPIIYLFLLNRYFFPFAFAVNVYAYMSLEFTPTVCKHFVRYEGATIIIAFGVTGLMMILRVNAIYGGGCRVVQGILGALWFGQVGVYAWLLSTGAPVPHAPSVHICGLIFDPKRLKLGALSATAPLLFDTAVVIFTLFKTLGSSRECGSNIGLGRSNVLLKTLSTDGALYFIVVFSSNLAMMIIILTASRSVKGILGQFTQLVTVTMMSRITLHLRKIGAKRNSTVIVSTNLVNPPRSSDGDVTCIEKSTQCTTRDSQIEFAVPSVSTGGGSNVLSSRTEAGPSSSQDTDINNDFDVSQPSSARTSLSPSSECPLRYSAHPSRPSISDSSSPERKNER